MVYQPHTLITQAEVEDGYLFSWTKRPYKHTWPLITVLELVEKGVRRFQFLKKQTAEECVFIPQCTPSSYTWTYWGYLC